MAHRSHRFVSVALLAVAVAVAIPLLAILAGVVLAGVVLVAVALGVVALVGGALVVVAPVAVAPLAVAVGDLVLVASSTLGMALVAGARRAGPSSVSTAAAKHGSSDAPGRTSLVSLLAVPGDRLPTDYHVDRGRQVA